MENAAITLTYDQLVKLGEGLAALDGLRTKPNEFEPFLFNPDTTWAIVENQTIVAGKLKTYTGAKKSLAVQHKITEGMPVTPENSPSVAAFMAGLDELNERLIEVVGLQKISREKLNVGHDPKKQQNKIPPSVLARLQPILEA